MNRILINRENIKKNLKALCKKASITPRQVMPVIKSDAYGHGLKESASVLADMGVWGFAVSDVEEAYQIRDIGIDLPILMLSGVFPGQEEAAVELKLTVGVHNLELLDSLNRVGAKRKKVVPIHIKVDTGMTRFGFSLNELFSVVNKRAAWPFLEFEGLFSHLSSADNPSDQSVYLQIKKFQEILKRVKEMGWFPSCVHLANSAASINFDEVVFDCIRPGLAIYGAYPGKASRSLVELFPVMAFHSKIVAVRDVAANVPVGYSHTFSTRSPSKIAVIPVGYDNGYMRSGSNRAKVLVKGVRCPVVGNICMKSFMVDVSRVSGPSIGDDVVLLGSQGRDQITIEEVASWAGTISYELLCLLGTRNKRVYVE